MAYVINHPQFTPPNDFQVFLAFIVFLAAEIGALRLEDIINYYSGFSVGHLWPEMGGRMRN